MNAPYMGKFRVSQCFSAKHTGLDLVGIDSKEIHSTINGKVIRAGWENEKNHAQGFGLRVVIQRSSTSEFYYFGHLSEIRVKVGDTVKCTDIIGIEGSTGYSTGSHCHYECRLHDAKLYYQDICKISGIPNKIGIYDDGYKAENPVPNVRKIRLEIDGEIFEGEVKKV